MISIKNATASVKKDVSESFYVPPISNGYLSYIIVHNLNVVPDMALVVKDYGSGLLEPSLNQDWWYAPTTWWGMGYSIISMSSTQVGLHILHDLEPGNFRAISISFGGGHYES
jgi:hypothetical protein